MEPRLRLSHRPSSLEGANAAGVLIGLLSQATDPQRVPIAAPSRWSAHLPTEQACKILARPGSIKYAMSESSGGSRPKVSRGRERVRISDVGSRGSW